MNLWNRFFTTIGGRIDVHETFGASATYRLGSSYIVPKISTKLKATLGTGFKAPSLYQLYSDYGTEDLKPEESIGWDMGLEQPLLNDMLNLGVMYFNNQFTNLIDYDYNTFTYQNIVESWARGVELFAGISPIPALKLQMNYTYTHTEETEERNDLLQRPRHKLKGTADYALMKRAHLSLEGIYVGNKYGYPMDRIHDYQIVNIASSYDLHRMFRIMFRIDNVLNEDYEDVDGYGTAGFSWYTGLKLSL
jgi:vitamin B12 transporter